MSDRDDSAIDRLERRVAGVREARSALEQELRVMEDAYAEAHAELDRQGAPRAREIEPSPALPNAVSDRVRAMGEAWRAAAAPVTGPCARDATPAQLRRDAEILVESRDDVTAMLVAEVDGRKRDRAEGEEMARVARACGFRDADGLRRALARKRRLVREVKRLRRALAAWTRRAVKVDDALVRSLKARLEGGAGGYLTVLVDAVRNGASGAATIPYTDLRRLIEAARLSGREEAVRELSRASRTDGEAQ